MKWNLKPKIKYVKVLIQEFEGKELVEPNKHYSKCVCLYDTTPKEVYDELLPFFANGGTTEVKAKKKKYHLTEKGKEKRDKAIRTYWKNRYKR